MRSYIISYDLMAPGKDYSDLFKKIRAYGTYAHILESVWVIKSDSSAVDIRDNLKTVMDSNDRLYVGKLASGSAWVNLGSSNSEWLKEHPA